MKVFWRKAIAASCVLAFVAGCSDKKDVPTKSEPTQTIGTEGKNLTFPSGVEVAVPKDAVTSDSRLTVTNPVTSPLPIPGTAKTAVQFDVSLEQNGKKDVQPSQPLSATVDLTGAWLPAGAKPQDAKVYTPIDGRLWMVPSQVVGTKLTMSLGHLSPKYITYVSDADLIKSFDANRVKKDPGSCAQQIAVDGGKVKFGSDAKGWSTKKDSPILACLYKGTDGYARIGILNRVPYVLSVSTDSKFRADESQGTADAELIKMVTRKLFPDANTQRLVAEGDTFVGSVKIDDLPSTINVRADIDTFISDVIIRDTQLLLDFLKASPTPAGETTELLDKVLGSSSVISCFQDLFKDQGSNPNQGSITAGSAKCMVEPIIDYITDKFGLGDLWSAIKFVKDGIGNLIAAAKYAWVGVVAVKGTIKVPVVAEMEAKFTSSIDFRGFHMPLYPWWKVLPQPPGVFFAEIDDMSTCKRAGTRDCASVVVGPGPSVDDPISLSSFCGPGTLSTKNIAGRSTRVLTARCTPSSKWYEVQAWEMNPDGRHITYFIPKSRKEMKGLDKAFAQATWE